MVDPDLVTAGMSDFDAFAIRSQAGAGGGPAAEQYRALIRQSLQRPSAAITAQISGMEEMAGARGGDTPYEGTSLGMRASPGFRPGGGGTGSGGMNPDVVRRVYGESMWRRMFPHLAAAEDAAREAAKGG